MIITCINCNKKFDIDSNLIPNIGRLLRCACCDHQWFFKKKVLENIASPIVDDIDIDSIKIFHQNSPSSNEEINPSDLWKEEAEVDTKKSLTKKIDINNEKEFDENIEINTNENTPVRPKTKKQKNFKILNIFIIAFISFVAFIIIVDTFKDPIRQVVPNIEFILYNLYESIKYISLFIRDLT
jgi:predicted Zn finger-like uncharacterized protein